MLSSAGALGRGFRSLAIRNYRLFWFGQLVSLAGTWMQDVALSWLVLSLTDSPVALGLTMTIRFLPALLLSAYGGILADRLPKRETLIAAQCLQMLIALSMAILTSTGVVTVLLIYVLAGIRGLVDAVEGPTRQAFVPEMVGTADVPNAVALNSTLFNAARVAGPALGAIIISNLGIAACFYVNAISFLAVIGALVAMRPRELRMVGEASKDAVGAGLRSGFRYVRSTPEIMIIFIIVGAIGTFGYNFQTLLPLVARYLLHSGASTLAVLMTAMGTGSVLAGLIAAYRGRPGRRFLLVASACFVVLLFSVGLSSSVAMTAALLFLAGAAGVLFMTAANTRIQLTVPDHLRGRVLGIYYMLFVGTTPIGSYVTGSLAEYGGVRMTVFILALLCAVGVAVAGVYAIRSRPLGRGTARPLLVRPGGGKGRFSVPHYGDRVEDGAQPE